MANPASTSAALPIAYVVLRLLVVVNWVFGAAILTLLVAMPTSQWIRSALGIPPSPEADRLIIGLHAIAIVGLAAIPVNHAVLKRLLAMVETVRAGDPFVAANASRLQGIAWALLALQLLSVVDRRHRRGDLNAGTSDRRRCRLLDQRLARRAADVPPGPRVHGRHAPARRPRRDGVTWPSPSSSTTCSTTAE